tara:strand:- start:4725 stop:6008 length:1284 start_codon:yes stop_codon:yes gene_type:complete
MKKIIKISLSVVILFVLFSGLKFFLSKDIFNIQTKIYKKYPNLKNDFRKNLFKETSVIENLKNDYNFKFLPDTQFIKLNLASKKLLFSEEFLANHNDKKKLGGYKHRFKSFFFDQFKEKILLTDYLGGTYEFDLKSLSNLRVDQINLNKIKNNIITSKVLDTLVDNGYFYISYIGGDKSCETMNIAMSKIENLSELKFENIFSSDECGDYIQAGRMVLNKKDSSNNLLFSTTNQTPDKLSDRPQSDDSIFGKIISLNLRDFSFEFYSKGHRNIQGLYSDNEVILATEHGPRGGDEINNILEGNNYGWPKASYGERYAGNKDSNVYLKSHKKYGFEEPIYAFVPSIGISEIIRLSNNFSNKFDNNYILTSLYGRNIFRIKFDEEYNKVIFMEKIYIGKRIRDIKFIEEIKSIIFAFEEDGEIGILSVS